MFKPFRILTPFVAIAAAGALLFGSASIASADQEGDNDSVVIQSGIATSGDAFAFWGDARTGDAEVENEAEVEQEIEQRTKSCRCDQDASNFSLVDQWGDALSGDAKAIFGDAKTGDAEVENEAEVEQEIEQKAGKKHRGMRR